MADNEYYRDAAKVNIIRQLNELKQKKYLEFGDKNIRIKRLIFKNIPSYGISDEELLVITDNVIKFLCKYPNDPQHAFTELPEEIRFYYRFINAMNELVYKSLVNIVDAKAFIRNEVFPNGVTIIEKVCDTNQHFITITDILNALTILNVYGIPKDEIDALRKSITIGLKSITTDNLYTMII